MNFKGLEKFAVFAVVLLALALIIPALVMAVWMSPTGLACVCAGIGISFGVWLKSVRWSIVMGSAGLVAAITLVWLSALLGGSALAWTAALIASVFSTSAAIFFGFVCLPK